MNVVFRVDSSLQIGTGHLMRCLTLANALKKNNVQVSFICRALPGNTAELISKHGLKLFTLPYNAHSVELLMQLQLHQQWLGEEWQVDAQQTVEILQNLTNIEWLVVDHYGLDANWEKEVKAKSKVKNIMVIDDLADRQHDCDILLDQNLYENLETRYTHLVPTHCKKLLGPCYALLRPEFLAHRQQSPIRSGEVERINIFFGGIDPSGETLKVIAAVKLSVQPEIMIDVIVGQANPRRDEIAEICAQLSNFNFYCQVNNMAELLAQANFAIGAGGTSTWERCCLGLPSLIISVAENQEQLAITAHKQGIAHYLGKSANVSVASLVTAINDLLADKARLAQMRNKAFTLVDGAGCDRVLERLL